MNFLFFLLRCKSVLLTAVTFVCLYNLHAQDAVSGQANPVQIAFEQAHPWRPPFALQRVGQSVESIIRVSNDQQKGKYTVAFMKENRQIQRQDLQFDSNVVRILVPAGCDEVVVMKERNGKTDTVVRNTPSLPAFECDAVARPVDNIHPIDLGAILVPADWLLLKKGQQTIIDVAVLSRKNVKGPVVLKSWFASAPAKATTTPVTIPQNKKITREQIVNFPVADILNDRLNIELVAADKTIWQKQIPVMVVRDVINKPSFGVVKTKLRYDVPITNIVNGKNIPFSYDTAWSPEKQDYIVFLPNGSRWVFWRGASYIPVWVSRYNTALSYEWAERISPNDGFTDCPEPLMDKKLKYGKVEVIEATSARIHIRWSYQSCDFNYKVNGDFAQEDYYFYPDGLGTRVLTLTSLPEAEYEVAEFILLAPQAAIPFAVMPERPMEMISLKSGGASSLSLPQTDTSWRTLPEPVVYRMKIHKDDPLSAFSFNPLLFQKPFAFRPFRDKGLTVTPAYWGGHWPLSQGFNTAYAINESIWSGPSHNSLITWGPKRPFPVRTKIFETQDAVGVKKKMREETFVWLIGMTDADNDSLFQIAKSFAEPAKLAVTGGWQEPDGYASERRAFKLVADSSKLIIHIAPQKWCVNPAFEIRNATPALSSIKLNGTPLAKEKYAWDGNTLWLSGHFKDDQHIELQFSN
jgi:hypothetical protein